MLRHVTAGEFETRLLCFNTKTLSSVSFILSVSTEICNALVSAHAALISFHLVRNLLWFTRMWVNVSEIGYSCTCPLPSARFNDNLIMHAVLESRLVASFRNMFYKILLLAFLRSDAMPPELGGKC